jgi:hypothetical protein
MNQKIQKLSREVTTWFQKADEFVDMVNPGGPRIRMKMGEMSDKVRLPSGHNIYPDLRLTQPASQLWSEGTISPQTGSKLVLLPAEVKLNIIGRLSTRTDEVLLSLTCKHFAQMDFVHRKKLKEKTASGKDKSYSKVNKLGLLVKLKPWMPAKYKLCYNCLRFKLAKIPGWKDNMEIVDKKLANTRALTQGPKCGLCCAALEIQQGKGTAQYKQLVAKVRAAVKRASI